MTTNVALQHYFPQKAAIALAIFITSIVFGLAPRWMLAFASNYNSMSGQQDILTMATLFGGGVFLGAAFMHLLSEASETFTENEYEFPVTYLLCCMGFMTILGFDNLAVFDNECHDHNHGPRESDLKMGSSQYNKSKEEHFNSHLEMMPASKFDSTTDEEAQQKKEINIAGQPQESISPMSGYALVGAMSFHSIFDGLAIGATNASSTQLTAVSIAVIAHKPIAAFALGSMLIKGAQQQELQQGPYLKRLMTRLIVFFAITSPVGIFLGVGTLVALEDSQSTWDTEIVSAVCQSFAAGTFLYVATVEVISKEFFSGRNDMSKATKVLKFGVCSFGVVLMALLKLLEADEVED